MKKYIIWLSIALSFFCSKSTAQEIIIGSIKDVKVDIVELSPQLLKSGETAQIIKFSEVNYDSTKVRAVTIDFKGNRLYIAAIYLKLISGINQICSRRIIGEITDVKQAGNGLLITAKMPNGDISEFNVIVEDTSIIEFASSDNKINIQ